MNRSLRFAFWIFDFERLNLMSLKEYIGKRDFKKTAEPRGKSASSDGSHRFVVQKHAASRLHSEYEINFDGFRALVLKQGGGVRLLSRSGKDLRPQSLASRKEQLEKLLKKAPPVIRCSASLNGSATELLKHARRFGLEGLIGKQEDFPYQSGQGSGAWVKPKLVCQIKFSEWTRDGKLRQPVFLSLREDKNPKEVVRETAA